MSDFCIGLVQFGLVKLVQIITGSFFRSVSKSLTDDSDRYVQFERTCSPAMADDV